MKNRKDGSTSTEIKQRKDRSTSADMKKKRKDRSSRSNKDVTKKDDMPRLALAAGNFEEIVAKKDDMPPLAMAPGNSEEIVEVKPDMPPLALAAGRYEETVAPDVSADISKTSGSSKKHKKKRTPKVTPDGKSTIDEKKKKSSVQKKHSTRSHGKRSSKNNADGNHYQHSPGRPSDESPGAVLVEGRGSIQTTCNIAELDNEILALIVATPLDDNDEEANLGENILENKIQEELELEIMKQQNKAVVAEPVDSTKASMDGATTNASGTEQADKKLFGLKRKIWCDIIVVVALLIVGVVAGVVVSSNKHGETSWIDSLAETFVLHCHSNIALTSLLQQMMRQRKRKHKN